MSIYVEPSLWNSVMSVPPRRTLQTPWDQPCSVEGCDRKVATLKSGLCRAHYQRAWKGNPLTLPTVEERFWLKVNKAGPVPEAGTIAEQRGLGPCWLWTASTNGSGYGQFKADGHQVGAHRFVYELLVGLIPEGLHLDHLCRVRICVNPEHLEPITPRENNLRGETFAALNIAKTRCPSGHEYNEVNTAYRNGSRICRTCERERNQRNRRRRALVKAAA